MEKQRIESYAAKKGPRAHYMERELRGIRDIDPGLDQDLANELDIANGSDPRSTAELAGRRISLEQARDVDPDALEVIMSGVSVSVIKVEDRSSPSEPVDVSVEQLKQ